MSENKIEINYNELEDKLKALTGNDFESCEKIERATGNSAVEISLSKAFQARLGAQALGLNVHDIKALPLNEYQKFTSRVMTFLFQPSDSDETEQPKE